MNLSRNYAVLRLGSNSPPGWEGYDGRWVDLDEMPASPPRDPPAGYQGVEAVATDRYETREDGVVARVYELRAAGVIT